MTSVIIAKKSGNCNLCGKDYPIGTRITYDKDKWVMADCKWPDKANKGGGTKPSYAVTSGTSGTIYKENNVKLNNPDAKFPTPEQMAALKLAHEAKLAKLKAQIDKDVNENLDFAITLAKSRLAENPQLEGNMQGVVSEIMHERYGTASQFRIHRLQAQDR